MALRQYIGARYVPKFYENGEWTANTAYEALTIVTRNGNSYTSKKPVPASVGAPESNPEYWVSTGIYNAQLEDIQTRLGDAESDITDLTTDLAAVDTYISNVSYNWRNKKVLLMGDSYGAGYTGASMVDGWPIRTRDYLGLDATILTNRGAGFNVVGNPESQYPGENYSAMLERVKDNEFQEIVIQCGINDIERAASIAALQTAITSTIEKIRTYWPKAGLHVIPVYGTYLVQNDRKTYADTLYSWTSLYGVHISKESLNWFTGQHVQFDGDDTTHLNAAGYRRLGSYIASFLLGSEFTAFKDPIEVSGFNQAYLPVSAGDKVDTTAANTLITRINYNSVSISAKLRIGSASSLQVLTGLPRPINTYLSFQVMWDDSASLLTPRVTITANGNMEVYGITSDMIGHDLRIIGAYDSVLNYGNLI